MQAGREMTSEGGSFWQNCSSLAENRQLDATTCFRAWKCESQLNWIRLSFWHCGCSKQNLLGQAEAKLRPGQCAEERNRDSKHKRVFYIPCPSAGWNSLVCAAITLYNRAAQPCPQDNSLSCSSDILSTWLLALHGRRGICPAQGKERYVCSELLLYKSLLDYLLWVKNSGQLRFTGLFCKLCFVNVGCFLLLGLLNWI